MSHAAQSRMFRRGMWRGVDKQTPAGANDLSFKRLENCYVSPDGLEIRRFPGWRCVIDLASLNSWRANYLRSYRAGPPIKVHTVESEMMRLHAFAQVRSRTVIIGEADHGRQRVFTAGLVEVAVLSWAAGTPGTVTLSAAPDTHDQPHGLGMYTFNAADTTGDAIYFEGTGSVELDGRFHRLAGIAGAVLTLEATLATSGTSAAAGRVYRVRQYNNPTTGHEFRTKSVLEPDGLATWTMRALPDPAAPLTSASVAVSFDRRPDYGDSTASLIRMLEGHRGVSRRRPRTVPVRPAVDIAGDRILLAVPGSPIVWQIPVIYPVGIGVLSPDLQNDVHDAPRSLGIPKGMLFDPGLKDVGHNLVTTGGGFGQFLAAGRYLFQVAYRDDGTGEVGLFSEPVEYNMSGSHNPVLWIMHPGYFYPECGALSVLILATAVNATETGLHRTQRISAYGVTPIVTTAGVLENGSLPFFYEQVIIGVSTTMGHLFGRDDLTFEFDPGTVRQLPMGSSAVRTVRAFTFFGGYVGAQGEAHQIDPGLLSAGFVAGDPTNRNRSERGQEVRIRLFGVNNQTLGGGFGAQTGAILYPSYAGQTLIAVDSFLPNAERLFTFDRAINPYSVDTSASLYNWLDGTSYRMQVKERLYQGAWATQNEKQAALVMPRGFYQWSEPDKPGAVPNVSNGYVDSDHEGVTGIGVAPNATVLCTRSQTHVLFWSKSPSGQTPVLVSNEHGCVAANSMVEIPGGCAWIGDRGPVSFVGGRFDWPGQAVLSDFVGTAPRYVRDRDGLMHLCWGAHDKERGLVYWGLRTNRLAFSIKGPDGVLTTWANASADLRTKFPADEVLVYSYRTGAISHWLPPQGLQLYWMAPLECADRVTRMCFMAEDGRVYALDDAWHDGSETGGTATPAAVANNSTAFTASAAAFNIPPVFTSNTYCRAGMEYAIYDPRTFGLKGAGTIVSVTNDTQLVLSEAASWLPTDVFVWGFQTMTAETRAESWATNTGKHALQAVHARYVPYAKSAATGSGATDPTGTSWADVAVRNAAGLYPLRAGKTNHFGHTLLRRLFGLEKVGTDRTTHTYHSEAGDRPAGDNQSVVVQFLGLAQVRLLDLEAEVVESQ